MLLTIAVGIVLLCLQVDAETFTSLGVASDCVPLGYESYRCLLSFSVTGTLSGPVTVPKIRDSLGLAYDEIFPSKMSLSDVLVSHGNFEAAGTVNQYSIYPFADCNATVCAPSDSSCFSETTFGAQKICKWVKFHEKASPYVRYDEIPNTRFEHLAMEYVIGGVGGVSNFDLGTGTTLGGMVKLSNFTHNVKISTVSSLALVGDSFFDVQGHTHFNDPKKCLAVIRGVYCDDSGSVKMDPVNQMKPLPFGVSVTQNGTIAYVTSRLPPRGDLHIAYYTQLALSDPVLVKTGASNDCVKEQVYFWGFNSGNAKEVTVHVYFHTGGVPASERVYIPSGVFNTTFYLPNAQRLDFKGVQTTVMNTCGYEVSDNHVEISDKMSLLVKPPEPVVARTVVLSQQDDDTAVVIDNPQPAETSSSMSWPMTIGLSVVGLAVFAGFAKAGRNIVVKNRNLVQLKKCDYISAGDLL